MTGVEIIIPTFISPHVFWIIEKKNLLLRNAITRTIKNADKKRVPYKIVQLTSISQQYAANVDDTWVRVMVDQKLTHRQAALESKYIICWLLDYGVMRAVSCVYAHSDDVKGCPPLARQASLHNSVNIEVAINYCIEQGKYVETYTKTVEELPGIGNSVLAIIECAEKLYFQVLDEDDIFYGDIFYKNQGEAKCLSLTEYLIDKKLMVNDPVMAQEITPRETTKYEYFELSHTYHQQLDRTEKFDRSIIFNDEINDIPMEYLRRTSKVFRRNTYNNDLIKFVNSF